MKFQDYNTAVEYLYQSLPMFHRIGAAALKPDLTNTIKLCAALNNPHRKFKSIHIAGTNGKGSTSHMLAAILQTAGYKTGLYTSPHLKEFTERVKIDGKEIGRDEVVRFVNELNLILDEIKPSFFEMTVALAFDHFAREKIDFGVIEVGLGGRLDSTNVITPEVSLITNISFDHTDLLGDTLEKIAGEKAGIIKRTIPVVISERQPEVEGVFAATARQLHAKIIFAPDNVELVKHGEAFNVIYAGSPWLENVVPELKGEYQRRNLPGVLATVVELRNLGYEISDEAVMAGIANAATLTGLKGRWQILGRHPLVVCDTGHNPAGIAEVVAQIRATPHRYLHFILGVVREKDLSAVLGLLPKDATYYFCQANIPRALDADILQKEATAAGLNGKVVRDVNEALEKARMAAQKEDMIFIGGSTFVVAEIDGL